MAKKRTLRNPLKAIRAKCLECCGGSPKEVRLCTDASCVLHPFRTGKNPFPRRKRALAKQTPEASAIGSSETSQVVSRQVQLSLFEDPRPSS
ncbi:hypothetical protein SAMN05660653_01894 [Desulfonatronum thiosulfatophilum]|uniref:Uncharacterized protein n=2 Tax=Desulfonatronum thiosulfatophilum TaxID=617002 RepID=A0A1G6D407_9BACT|nr:hypothetical protein SAMN05660653_01894 [Desulfonatronum thiosulfatophilum]